MAKKNKDKESCDAFFYFNLDQVLRGLMTLTLPEKCTI